VIRDKSFKVDTSNVPPLSFGAYKLGGARHRPSQKSKAKDGPSVSARINIAGISQRLTSGQELDLYAPLEWYAVVHTKVSEMAILMGAASDQRRQTD
jgi:hypothetical protein